MVKIIDGKNKTPFMRGMLVQYLIQRGIEYKKAREVADEVRLRVAKFESIDAPAMLTLVREVINVFKIDCRLGDLQFWERQITQILVEEEEVSP